MPARALPLTERELPAAAEFLARALRTTTTQTSGDAVDPAAVHDRLRWRIVDPPLRLPGVPAGELLRDDAGAVAGTIVYTAQRFRAGDGPVVGLLGSYFYVDPSARTGGYFLLRRFLATAGVDFHYATSCNALSARLWKLVGGSPVAGSEIEVLVPLRAAAFVEELARRAHVGQRPARWLGAASRIAGLALRQRRPRGVRVEPSSDWKLLATIAERERSAGALRAELSPDFLAWRFERSPAAAAIDVALYTDGAGRSGWFATLATRRGVAQQMRTRTVLAAVPPRGTDPDDLVAVMAARYAPDSDAIVFATDETALGGRLPRLWRRRFEAPRIFVAGQDARGRPFADSLALCAAAGDAIESS